MVEGEGREKLGMRNCEKEGRGGVFSSPNLSSHTQPLSTSAHPTKLPQVLGKGLLPKQPLIVKAKFFSKTAEAKIKSVGGACVLTA